MNISIITEEDIRRIFREELSNHFGQTQSFAPLATKEDDLIDSKEACRILGCGERTLQRYRTARLMNVVYRGPHRCYYYRSEILAFRAANTRTSRDNK